MSEVVDISTWRNKQRISRQPREFKVGGKKVLEFGLTPREPQYAQTTTDSTSIEHYIDITAVQNAAKALFDLEMALKMPSSMQRVIAIRELTERKDECMEELIREEKIMAIAQFKEMISNLDSPEAS
jgi:hypothetical protein